MLKKFIIPSKTVKFRSFFTVARTINKRFFLALMVLFYTVGVPKEIKPQEDRVSLTPSAVRVLTEKGAKVVVQSNAGENSGYSDDDYSKVGAVIVETAKESWGEASLIVKVKEPMQEEYDFIQPGHLLFTFLHLAGSKLLTEVLMKSGVTAIAYETVVKDGRTILLEPSSIVAGVLGAYQAAFYLTHADIQGDKVEVSADEREQFEHRLNSLTYNTLFDTPPYNLSGKIALVLGGGTVGKNASKILAEMGAKVYIIQREGKRIPELQLFISQEELERFNIQILITSRDFHNTDLASYLKEQYSFDLIQIDIIIGAAYSVGKKAALIIDRDTLKKIRTSKKRVIVDISIDQGGNIYGSRATTHKNPVYLDEFGNIRYGVTNMPGRVPRISTTLLGQAIFPYVLALAEKGIQAMDDLPELKSGINVINGKLVNKKVAESLDLPYTPLEDVVAENSLHIDMSK
ncbi:MAG: alanine dehydrogenase [Halobacteriota archaeon]